MDPEHNTQLNHKAIRNLIIAGFGILFVVLLIITLSIIFRRNPYGNEIKIDNFATYYADAPEDTRDIIFNNLYTIVKDNSPENTELPKSGAKIRDGEAQNDFYEDLDLHYGNFIVDLESVQQSYRVQFEWSEKSKNKNLSGYSVLLTCVDADLAIYKDFVCHDSLSGNEDPSNTLAKDFPLMLELPITIDYYIGGYGRQVYYEITNQINGEEYTVVITDYTGGNKSAALDKIRSLGFDPDDYTIEYRDYSAQNYYAF